MSSLIVHPDFQNNGLGKETLAYLIEWFSEKSVNKITLQSTEHGEKLYKKMGFNKSIENTFIKEC
ncbi:GNAT family N-acetyltransferase [Staphylococcus saprophyticus]|uniref:GNAT family N-acetyltransferase n=1 Tax=Staphylococcus saprophyticus TaxID=29385 RepID=UPI001584781D|nr:GNAT family N-acetyltransferase [Staphylococcus saprophyticus]